LEVIFIFLAQALELKNIIVSQMIIEAHNLMLEEGNIEIHAYLLSFMQVKFRPFPIEYG